MWSIISNEVIGNIDAMELNGSDNIYKQIARQVLMIMKKQQKKKGALRKTIFYFISNWKEYDRS